jgi:hypothetical protein
MSDSNNTEPVTDDSNPLFEANHAAELERADRENPIPGGEPPCPVCGTKLARLVEAHHAPNTGDTPFRVRLVCSNRECRRWTVYNW